MNSRTLWACQSVAFMISARVAPFGRPIISRIFAPLLSARGVAALRPDFAAAFLPALSLAAVAAFAPFVALGSPFFEGAFSGAAFSVASALVMLFLIILSARAPRMTIHHSGSPGRQGNCDRLGGE